MFRIFAAAQIASVVIATPLQASSMPKRHQGHLQNVEALQTVADAKEALREIATSDCEGGSVLSTGLEFGAKDGQQEYLGTFQCIASESFGTSFLTYNARIDSDGGFLSVLVPQDLYHQGLSNRL